MGLFDSAGDVFGPPAPSGSGGGIGGFLGGLFDIVEQGAQVVGSIGSALNSVQSGLAGIQTPTYVPPTPVQVTPQPNPASSAKGDSTLLVLAVVGLGLYLLAKK